MARLFVGALISVCVLSAAAGTSAVADAPASSPASAIASRAPALPVSTAPATLAHLVADTWASQTSAYADLVAATEAALPTAVYDIMAHVVVMPSGDRLEAHSGLRDRVDDPRFVAEHMRGATPPALYDLEPRKRPFHGIAALRLKPLSGDVFGRSGLLAHTYMLHGRPESNGCVVFRDYDAFLSAFREGQIKRLRVVPSVGDAGALIEIARSAGRKA